MQVTGFHSAALFTEPSGGGPTLYDRWIHKALDYYQQYPEVNNILLSADGQPVLDSFGRPREAPYKPGSGMEPPLDKVKKGAVWMTRDTLRTAFEAVVGVSYYKDDPRYSAGYAARKSRTHDPAKASSGYAHPMDKTFRRMIQRGYLIKAGGNRFMVSEAECKRLGREDVWQLHLDRGWRWERLAYERTAIPAMEGKELDQALVKQGYRVEAKRPVVRDKSLRNAKEAGTKELFNRIADYLVVDFDTILRLHNEIADELGTLTHINPETDKTALQNLRTYIVKWVQGGKLLRVLSGLYQHPDLVYLLKGTDKKPLIIKGDWRIPFCIKHANEYLDTMEVPSLTMKDIRLDIIECDPTLNDNQIRVQFQTLVKNGIFHKTDHNKFCIHPSKAVLFAPERSDEALNPREDQQYDTILFGPINEAIDALDEHVDAEILWKLLRKIIKQDDDLAYKLDAGKVCRKLKWNTTEFKKRVAELVDEFGFGDDFTWVNRRVTA